MFRTKLWTELEDVCSELCLEALAKQEGSQLESFGV